MKKIIKRLIALVMVIGFASEVKAANAPHVEYQTHIQNIGWEERWKNKGDISGTTGRGLHLEALRARIIDGDKLGISYSAHVQNIGWQKAVGNGALSGTTGRNLQIEALKMRLTGDDSNKYDLYYAVHVANLGWLNWAKNNEVAGTTGYCLAAEAVAIKILPKGEATPSTKGRAFASYQAKANYNAHVQNIGWQKYVSNGATAGTTGRKLRVEAFHLNVQNGLSGSAQYRSHVQNIGWETNWKSNGTLSGTTAKAYRLEAIQIKLTGTLANYYNVYYRTHIQNFGWSGWASNGASCGSQGYAYRLEAMQIKLMPKGAGAPGSTKNTFHYKTKTAKKTICIDPGHQRRGNNATEPIGPGAKTKKPKVTTGATGVATKRAESQVNLEVALKLKKVLEQRGYHVVMCRTTQNVNISNKERADIANKANAAAFIRLHCDSSPSGSAVGATGLAPANNNPYLSKSVIASSQSLTRQVVNGLCKATGAKNRGVSRRNDLSGINWSKVPVCLIEMGFMSNANEDRNLSNSSYQQKLANGIANGIDAYLK